MPEISGEMTAEEIEHVQGWLNAHWTSSIREKCPMCNQSDPWEIDENIGKVDVADWRPMGERSTPGANRHFPAIVINCKECGYMLLFNAVVMRLWPRFPSGSVSLTSDDDHKGRLNG